MAETKMEFAVQMTCKSCEESIRRALNVPGITNVFVDISNEIVLIDTTLPSSTIKGLLESTGKLVVFRGFGGQGSKVTGETPSHHGAAVVVMKGCGQVGGLIRMVQVSPEVCIIEGTIDGLQLNESYFLKVHEYGDLSNGCESCGDVYHGVEEDSSMKSSGELGLVQSNDKGKTEFQIKSNSIKVWNVIGRSIILHNKHQERLMCGIIARSAGLFQNSKKVCTCDGVTIWEEAEAQRLLKNNL